ncbi:MAG: metallophosphatase family protein [Marinilabiliales bacterium]|nr:MAG: metallophosphatase family protein [Marinilabiliales bacterium]
MKLGFLSDIHEDVVSLKKGLDVLYREHCDQIICLGDIIGFSNPYYPFGETKDANACIDLVRENCTIVVPGNHDLFSAGRIPMFHAGIEYPENWYRMEISDRMNLMKGKIWFYEHEVNPGLTEENIQYLRSLPEYDILKIDDYSILVTHFVYPDISGSLRKRIDEIYEYRDHFWFMRQNNCILSFAGHMHREGFEVINMMGFREYGFKKKRLMRIESFIGLPSIAFGQNKNGVAVFDTESFEIKVVRLR